MTSTHSFRVSDLVLDPIILDQQPSDSENVSQLGPVSCEYITFGELESIPLEITNFVFLHVNCRSSRKNFQSLVHLLMHIKVKP